MSDIALEALEVFINHILYVRDVYPGQIFKKRRIYNTPVYISIYPPLNTYLYKILRASRELLKTQELQAMELLLFKDDKQIYERYLLRTQEPAIATNDEFLLEFEDQLRTSLCRVSERLKGLAKLSSDCKFKILLHTSQSAFVRLTHNAHYQVWSIPYGNYFITV